MQCKRFLQLVVTTTAINVLAVGATYAEIETVVVVGNRCGDGSCKTGPFYNQQMDYDPFALLLTGGGIFSGFNVEAMKRIVDAIEPPCKRAGVSDADYVKGAVSMCVAKAAAGYSAMFGVAIGGMSSIITQSQCNIKVQEALAAGNSC